MGPGAKRWPLGLCLLVGLLALGACQTTNKSPVATAPAAPAAVESGEAAQQEAVTVEPAPQVAALPPQAQPAPEPVEPPIDDDPGQLMGLDRSGLTNLLGKPDLVRREQPAEIWQYVTADCVFDVVLYDSGQRYQVTYLEARNAEADRLSPRPCLNQILRARLDVPVS